MAAVVPPPDEVAIFTVEIRYHADGASGYVTPHGFATPAAFSSWLELLRLLEQPSVSQDPHQTVHKRRPDPEARR